jgi:hypothetical protein
MFSTTVAIPPSYHLVAQLLPGQSNQQGLQLCVQQIYPVVLSVWQGIRLSLSCAIYESGQHSAGYNVGIESKDIVWVIAPLDVDEAREIALVIAIPQGAVVVIRLVGIEAVGVR